MIFCRIHCLNNVSRLQKYRFTEKEIEMKNNVTKFNN